MTSRLTEQELIENTSIKKRGRRIFSLRCGQAKISTPTANIEQGNKKKGQSPKRPKRQKVMENPLKHNFKFRKKS